MGGGRLARAIFDRGCCESQVLDRSLREYSSLRVPSGTGRRQRERK